MDERAAARRRVSSGRGDGRACDWDVDQHRAQSTRRSARRRAGAPPSDRPRWGRRACEIAGLDVRTVQRWRGRPDGDDLRRGPKTVPANKITAEEEATIVELVTSPEVRERVSDQTCANAIAEMTRFFAKSDIAGGIVAGTHMLQTAIGTSSADQARAAFPDIIES